MATGNKFPEPPQEERTDKPAPVRRKVARAAALAAAPRKSVLIINDDDSIYSDDSQSVAIFMSAFKALEYDVKLEKSEETTYTTWKNYDIVVWSCSDDYSAVSDDNYRKMLIEYVGSGGHLILESGNIAAWNKEEGVTTLERKFREQVLHATDDWVYHDVGDLKLKTKHPVATIPNILPETISFTPTDPGDESGDANAVRILSDAMGIFNWSYVAYDGNHRNDAVEDNSYGLIAYDGSGENGSRIIYYAFDIDDIADPDIQQKLIQNSENWLRGG